MGSIGGQCPGASDLKGAPADRREKEKRKIIKRNGRDGGPESPLSTGPEHPRYATACIACTITMFYLFFSYRTSFFIQQILECDAEVLYEPDVKRDLYSYTLVPRKNNMIKQGGDKLVVKFLAKTWFRGVSFTAKVKFEPAEG